VVNLGHAEKEWSMLVKSITQHTNHKGPSQCQPFNYVTWHYITETRKWM